MEPVLTGFPAPASATENAPDRLRPARLAVLKLLKDADVDLQWLRQRHTERAYENGASHWHTDAVFTVERVSLKDAAELRQLIGRGFVSVHKADDFHRITVRDRRRDSISGPGYREHEISVTETVDVKVVSVTGDELDPLEFAVVMEVRGEGEYSA